MITVYLNNTCYDDIPADSTVEHLYKRIGFYKPLLFEENVRWFKNALADLGICPESRIEQGELDEYFRGLDKSFDSFDFKWKDFTILCFPID